MNARIHIILLLLVPLVMGCYKDDLDVADLNNNPFDPEYVGPAVFELEGTYTQFVDLGEFTVLYQVIEVRVREDLFLSSAAYTVQLTDLQLGMVQNVVPDPPGSNIWKYYREPAPGQEICVELRLANNQSTAGATTFCVTL